jgi:GNAT superfamily N-acetyltransferase
MASHERITLRPARLSDLHAMNRVKTGATLDMIGPHSRILRDGHRLNPKRSFSSAAWWRGAVVAEIEGRVVGVVRTRGALFSDLWVERSVRSQGIGAELLRAGENRIRAQGHRFTHLLTAHFNARGRSFYERNGWTLVGFTQHRVCHFRRCVYEKRL